MLDGLADQSFQVIPILTVLIELSPLGHLFFVNPLLAISDLFRARDLQAGTFFDRTDEATGIVQTFVGAGIKPRRTTAEISLHSACPLPDRFDSSP